MKLAYIYPEVMPSKKARAISVINSAYELAKKTDTILYISSESDFDDKIYSLYNLKNQKLKIKNINKKFLGLKSNKFFNKNLLKQLENDDIDVVYLRHLKTVKYLLSKKNRFKIIFECHEVFSNDNPKLKKDEQFIYKNVDGLVFINNTLKNLFYKEFDIKKVPYEIIHNGTNFNLEFKQKDFTKIDSMFYIGNFYVWKGIHFLIKSLINLKSINLNIIGDGDKKEELIELSKGLNVESQIKFFGFKNTNEIKKILLESKLTIIPNIPSKYSNFSSPIKLYEYMATSNIVIAANMATIKEIIVDGQNGFLFESGNLKSLEETIKKVLAMPNEKLQEIAKCAYETSKNFTWENRGKQIYKFAKKLK